MLFSDFSEERAIKIAPTFSISYLALSFYFIGIIPQEFKLVNGKMETVILSAVPIFLNILCS